MMIHVLFSRALPHPKLSSPWLCRGRGCKGGRLEMTHTTNSVQVERQIINGWTFGTTDVDSEGNSVLVTAMFCKWCKMAGFKHNDRGKLNVCTGAGGGCQRAKLQSVKDHEGR
jgi:hypothetical protein